MRNHFFQQITTIHLKPFLVGILFLSFVLTGCVTTTPPKPEDPVEPLNYSFSFEHPEKSNQKIGITIGIVSPQWEKDSFVYGAAFSAKANERLMKPNMQATKGPIPRELYEIIKEFDKSVGNEFESMMVSRGFNTMGPFDKIEDMTYPQKKACNLVLYPEFNLKIADSPELVEIDEVKGRATLRSEIILNIIEPLSKEKLWMKKISLQSEPFPYKFKFNFHRLYTQKGNLAGYQRNGIKWDNRTQRVAAALSSYYKDLMQQAWKYFSPEELSILKSHSDEIRERKRF